MRFKKLNPVLSISFNRLNYLHGLTFISFVSIIWLFFLPESKIETNPISPVEPKTNSFPVNSFNASSQQSTQSLNQIVTDALAFYNLLSAAQKSTLQLTYTTALARKWSNLPCGISCRNGLQLGTNLTASQYSAAMQLIRDVLSNTSNEGYDEFHQMNLAEAYLHINGGANSYDSTLRWMAFLNTPSTTGAWMLQFGGHHYAANIAFNNGHVIGATPFFMGLEPKTFTYNSVSYDPLGQERDSLRALLASLTTAQLSTAYISTAFSDCVMIPGETNGGAASFPAVAIGQSLSALPNVQRLALAAIKLYVGDMDSATRVNVMDTYSNEIGQTYVSYHDNGTSGNAASFLTDQTDYVRISGPHVWIEFSCQGGIVIRTQIHYHTVWRDRSHDYGVDLSGAPIDQGVVLPLKLTSFTGTINNGQAMLKWTTINESDIDHFEVEKSPDALNFSSIGSIQATNLSTTNHYYYNTSGLSSPVNYFRLKFIDKDGTSTYSNIITLNFSSDKEIFLVKNNVTDELIINHPTSLKNAFYRIMNVNGQILASGKLEQGSKISKISTSLLLAGQYILIIQDDKQKNSFKFVKS